jgi:AcrR family transcriptional regulator
VVENKSRVRRQPRQLRSIATVDVLLDAVGLVVAVCGVEAVTMRAVVKRAGVSPGSMYQYFSSRESLIAAWERRELERRAMDLLAVVAAADENARARTVEENPRALEDTIRVIARAAIDTIGQHLTHYRQPGDFIVRLSEIIVMADGPLEMITATLSRVRMRERLRPRDLTMAARVGGFATVLSAHLVATSKDEPTRAACREEVVEMLVHYLVRDAQN